MVQKLCPCELITEAKNNYSSLLVPSLLSGYYIRNSGLNVSLDSSQTLTKDSCLGQNKEEENIMSGLSAVTSGTAHSEQGYSQHPRPSWPLTLKREDWWDSQKMGVGQWKKKKKRKRNRSKRGVQAHSLQINRERQRECATATHCSKLFRFIHLIRAWLKLILWPLWQGIMGVSGLDRNMLGHLRCPLVWFGLI